MHFWMVIITTFMVQKNVCYIIITCISYLILQYICITIIYKSSINGVKYAQKICLHHRATTAQSLSLVIDVLENVDQIAVFIKYECGHAWVYCPCGMCHAWRCNHCCRMQRKIPGGLTDTPHLMTLHYYLPKSATNE